MVKPNLFIPGAAKSGTSSFHNYLNLHPDVFMSEIKEPLFFSHDDKYQDPIEKEKYYSLFIEGKNYKYIGESSTGYMVLPNVIERIKFDIGNPKFIFLLRNPIDRIFSHYNWLKNLGGESDLFENVILIDKDIEPKFNVKYKFGYRNYYQFGLYGKWLENFYQNFPSKDILILLSEDLKSDPLETMNKCFDFLEIENLNSININSTNKTENIKNPILYRKILEIFNSKIIQKTVNKLLSPSSLKKYLKVRKKIFKIVKKQFINKTVPSLSLEQRAYLKNLYAEDVKLLKKITGMDFSKWEDFY